MCIYHIPPVAFTLLPGISGRQELADTLAEGQPVNRRHTIEPIKQEQGTGMRTFSVFTSQE